MPYLSIDLNMKPGRLPYFNLIHKQTEKLKFKKHLTKYDTYLRTFGLGLDEVKIRKIDDNEENNGSFKLDIIEERKSIDTASLCQKVRDIASVSEKSYTRLRKTLLPITKLASLKKCNMFKRKINEIWQLGYNSLRSYIKNPKIKIKSVCEQLIKRLKTEEFYNLTNNTFNILLYGDGIQISKTHINIVNFCFSLIDEKFLNIDKRLKNSLPRRIYI